MVPNPLEDRPLTIEEAAEFLTLSRWTLYHKVARGEIAVSRPGRKLYFQRQDLVSYASQNRSPASFELQAQARQLTAS